MQATVDGLTSKAMLDLTIKENFRGEVAEPPGGIIRRAAPSDHPAPQSIGDDRHQNCAELIADLEALGLANDGLSFLDDGGAPAAPKPAAAKPPAKKAPAPKTPPPDAQEVGEAKEPPPAPAEAGGGSHSGRKA